MKYFKSILKVLKPQSISNLKIIVPAFRTYSFVSLNTKYFYRKVLKYIIITFKLRMNDRALGRMKT